MTNFSDDENQKPHQEKNGLDNEEQEQQCLWEKEKQVNLYSHLKKKKPIPKLLTFYVEQPVYKEYAHINLSKANIKKRIFRQRSITDHQKFHETAQTNPNINKVQNRNKWNEAIEKYIETKQKSLQKNPQTDEIEGYPLMKLSKMNERLRKIKTNPTFGDKKPQFVQKMQKQELFSPKPINNRKSLPYITTSNKKFSIKTKKNSSTTQKSEIQNFPLFRNQTHIVKVKQVIRQKEKKKLFFKELNETNNKSEKVIINFIGNYFRQKFSPQRRFSYQRSYNQFDEDLSMKIS